MLRSDVNHWRKCGICAVLALAVLLAGEMPAWAQHGIILSGGGPIGRSMGGVGTATALDSLGGLFWNPAALSALPRNEMTFGAEFLIPHANLSSSVEANNFGPGVPPVPLAGSTNSQSGSMVLPNVGWSHHLEDSDLTLGLGLLSAAGLSANYPASLTNPVLTPPPPVGLGVGRAFAELQVFQIVPTIAWQVTDRLAVGFSPIVDIASLRADPLLLVAPNDANGNGFATFPDGTHSHLQWGAGFQVGVYYSLTDDWHLGASFKSPQWFETFRFNSADELGRPLSERVRFDLPLITSVGVSYTGLERWVLAADVRYIDYHNTKGFDTSGFAADGAVRGLGWDSQVVVAVGAQYALTDRVALRIGYSYNNNPETSDVAFFNIAAPTIVQHTLYAGASWSLTETLVLALAYVHAFEGEVDGPFILPVAGAIPGTNVQSRTSADAFVMGLTVKY
jgi:long-chain fatty acid transport protein